MPPESATPPPFAAAIVIHNSERHLGPLFSSIENHISVAPQIVVVDTGSTDRGADLARAHGAVVIDRPDNPGFGAANNLALAHIECDVTVLVNPDVELLDGSLIRLVAEASRGRALLVPRLLNSDGSVQRSAHPLPGTVEALLPALVHPRALPRFLRLRADPWRSERPRRIGWALAACLVAPTHLLRALGPFDERIFLFYEDLDLALRAHQAGIPLELRPDVVLRHHGSHSTFPAYGGEPYSLLARRRREVVGRHLGRRGLVLDDAAQRLAFGTRAAARMLLMRDATRERAQLAAVRQARRESAVEMSRDRAGYGRRA